jgi:hypothetical protein
MLTQDPVVGLIDELAVEISADDFIEFDSKLFQAPFVLVARNNKSLGVVATLDDALRALADQWDVATYVATLRPAYLGMDIDPGDRGADPEAGEAASDALVSWCERRGLGWLRRASGRDGHRHVVAKIPLNLRQALQMVARDIADHHGVSITVRSSLRPLGAPHRLGLVAKMIDQTLDPSDFANDVMSQPGQSANDVLRSRARLRGRPAQCSLKRSRSEGEFGEALARIRAGWDEATAWKAADCQGSKAAEIGRRAWRRWVWAPAVTVIDAERNVDEKSAWRNFRRASPEQGRHLGYDAWFQSRWLPAREEAGRRRPRRLRTTRGPEPVSQDASRQRTGQSTSGEVDKVAHILMAAARERGGTGGRLPGGVKLATLCIALAALARSIVRRNGSISIRSWAEAASLDPKTIRRARDAAVVLGLIHRVHAYQGDAKDCDAWLPTPDVAKRIDRFAPPDNSPTGRYAPRGARVGSANPLRMKQAHLAERQCWLRWLEARTPLYKKPLPAEREPAEKSATATADCTRRNWWKYLSGKEQRFRRSSGRRTLGGLLPRACARWLVWLRRRKGIAPVTHRELEDTEGLDDWT